MILKIYLSFEMALERNLGKENNVRKKSYLSGNEPYMYLICP